MTRETPQRERNAPAAGPRVYHDLRSRQVRRARVAAMLATIREERTGRSEPALFVAGRSRPIRAGA